MDLHPFMQRREIATFCQEEGIQLEVGIFFLRRRRERRVSLTSIPLKAWAPLARGMRFGHPTVIEIAKKHSKTEAQVLLRWGLENVRWLLPVNLDVADPPHTFWQDYVVIPKSVKSKRIDENTNVFGFKLDSGDMIALNRLEEYLITDWSAHLGYLWNSRGSEDVLLQQGPFQCQVVGYRTIEQLLFRKKILAGYES
jgi:diketogulonate reductase-like aldo/keto reductase